MYENTSCFKCIRLILSFLDANMVPGWYGSLGTNTTNTFTNLSNVLVLINQAFNANFQFLDWCHGHISVPLTVGGGKASTLQCTSKRQVGRLSQCEHGCKHSGFNTIYFNRNVIWNVLYQQMHSTHYLDWKYTGFMNPSNVYWFNYTLWSIWSHSCFF